jgi:hypothetical protein
MAPAAFLGPPQLEDVIYAVNANTDRVQSLQSDSISLSSPGLPSLRANMALERPRRFRMRGSFLGPEIDVGSNNELFWFWAKSNPEPVVYFARHDDFRGSAARQILPVEPAWLIDAFGLVRLEPGGVHNGPIPHGDGRVEIRSRIGAAGELERTLVVDAHYGWVVEQYVRDQGGQTLAAARASNHRFYPDVGVSLPHHIEIQFPPAELALTVDVGKYSVNQLSGDTTLWSLPEMEGYSLVNLADAPISPGRGIPSTTPDLQTGFRPPYRGYTR